MRTTFHFASALLFVIAVLFGTGLIGPGVGPREFVGSSDRWPGNLLAAVAVLGFSAGGSAALIGAALVDRNRRDPV